MPPLQHMFRAWSSSRRIRSGVYFYGPLWFALLFLGSGCCGWQALGGAGFQCKLARAHACIQHHSHPFSPVSALAVWGPGHFHTSPRQLRSAYHVSWTVEARRRGWSGWILTMDGIPPLAACRVAAGSAGPRLSPLQLSRRSSRMPCGTIAPCHSLGPPVASLSAS